MHPTLQSAVDGLYSGFADAPRPHSIEGCPCCAEPGAFEFLSTLPLRSVPADRLLEYAYSAITTVGSIADFRYLLPRLVEAALEGPVGAPDPEIVFARVQYGRWYEWPAAEREALTAFASAVGEWLAAEPIPHYDLDSWICALGQFLPDVVPYLGPLLGDTPAAKTNLITYFERHERDVGRGSLSGAWWEKPLPAMPLLIAWLRSETVTEALGRAYASGAAG